MKVLRPTWYELAFENLASWFTAQFEVVEANVRLLPSFPVSLMDDGESLTVAATTSFLEHLSSTLELPSPEASTGKKLSTADRFMQVEGETAEIRRLILSVTEQLSCHQTVTNQMFSRQSELVDASINRSKEDQIEIRGFRLKLSSASAPEERHRDHQLQVHALLQGLVPSLQFKASIYGE
jgi:hypothetical protein